MKGGQTKIQKKKRKEGLYKEQKEKGSLQLYIVLSKYTNWKIFPVSKKNKKVKSEYK